MERLTQRVKDGILVKESHGENSMKTMYQCFGDKPNENYFNCDEGYCAMEKLAEYEDAEENGLLIKLPCKVGSKVYRFAGINGSGRIIDSTFCISDLNEIGKTVFLTKEETEAKLAEMRGEQHE